MVCLDIWHYWHFGLEILSGKSFLFTTGCFVSSLNSTHRYCFIYDNLGKWKSVMSDSLWPHGLQPARLSCQWNSIGQNTGVGSHSLFQGIFPTQVLNPRLSDWTQVSSIAGRFFTIWAMREAQNIYKYISTQKEGSFNGGNTAVTPTNIRNKTRIPMSSLLSNTTL